MANFKNILFLFLLILKLSLCICFYSQEEENKFINSLVNKTSRYSKPPNLLNDTVEFSLDLFQIVDIDERQGIIKIRIYVLVDYIIPELAWNPEDTNGVDYVLVPEGTVWTPDLLFYDAVKVDYDAFSSQGISNDGTVTARTSSMTFQIACPWNALYFPFDSQVKRTYCQIIIFLKFRINLFV